jgi:predicted RNase H-like HicB family nuclease
MVQVSKEEVADGVTLYLAINPELEGCMAQGDSPEEAIANLDEVRTDYIEHLLDHKLPVPSPFTTVTTSGITVPPDSNPVVEISAGDFGQAQKNQREGREDREILFEAWAKA